ncbi:hypothetical protein SERLA73DRAFT_121013 [Serpula lacrymans var. lacrymans S7.3]|uniref:Uncharacterized protein n=2 Tax=Serpula lacrymans var. lacrymans TaxID=341189 RepID=F8PTK0_SERL3|nr:uncharacterized protein SERLADRAFT_367715 [Serpula lacrymans var. lacrymans S7.9]EGO00528.1 hypothetical protein SERLA73DRAFT_121013 [Serpula lacrymans var. lacrymans S7.3]EGO26087.1 hypothetical protein SERLADRAFT_367715 [Serpula lacrymans var. lacrymans S7.9]
MAEKKREIWNWPVQLVRSQLESMPLFPERNRCFGPLNTCPPNVRKLHHSRAQCFIA